MEMFTLQNSADINTPQSTSVELTENEIAAVPLEDNFNAAEKIVQEEEKAKVEQPSEIEELKEGLGITHTNTYFNILAATQKEVDPESSNPEERISFSPDKFEQDFRGLFTTIVKGALTGEGKPTLSDEAKQIVSSRLIEEMQKRYGEGTLGYANYSPSLLEELEEQGLTLESFLEPEIAINLEAHELSESEQARVDNLITCLRRQPIPRDFAFDAIRGLSIAGMLGTSGLATLFGIILNMSDLSTTQQAGSGAIALSSTLLMMVFARIGTREPKEALRKEKLIEALESISTATDLSGAEREVKIKEYS